MRDNLGVEYTDVYGDKLRTELGQCPNPHKESKLSLLMLDRNLGGGGEDLQKEPYTCRSITHFTLNLTKSLQH